MPASDTPDPSASSAQEDRGTSTLNFPVIGIGASAGAVNALQRFFEQLPADTGMAFVLIMHLSPTHESNIAAILQRLTQMPVTQVVEETPLASNHVYVIAPTTNLSMNDGRLMVSELQSPRGPHIAIDLFFRTLAEAHGERAVSIVMSGTGADGAIGLTRIKEEGGITIAQAPEDAEYDGMPRSAIATGMVDFVLPAVEMPQKLLDLWKNARSIKIAVEPEGARQIDVVEDETEHAAENALRDIMALLRARTRHDFRHYKRATVLRRIERRLQVNGLTTLPAYREYLREHPSEAMLLLQDMLISVTNFFRDHEAFEALERNVIPSLFEGRSAQDPIRVWIPGCASGEEAYSIAILLREASERHSTSPDIQLFATDIDERAINAARTGLYSSGIAADISPARLRQFFSPEQGAYRIGKNIREKVLFALHNLLRDPPFSRLDMICCRNLLIYLDREAQAEILETFRFALKPDGVLFLGSSESADAASSAFAVFDKKHRIYRSKSDPQAIRLLPTHSSKIPVARRFVPAMESTPERRVSTYAELHQRALEFLSPPSVLIDAQHNVLHLSEGVARFLEHSSGLPSHNLLTNVQPDLRPELRTALFRSVKSGGNEEARAVLAEIDGEKMRVDIIVRPFSNPANGSDLIVVIFQEVPAVSSSVGGTVDSGTDFVVHQLEAEIQRLKSAEQHTIEQAETSNEELKASNEELQAINEELRSATEELETSKEELQSINEELIAVNFELKAKVDETAKINDDLQNLIASTDIATVFINSGMRIKRFTPRAADIFNVIASDIGRSLLDITHRLDYDALSDDAAEVFRSLRAAERRVTSSDGRNYLARMLPYRTTDDKIEGAILTFVDITQLHQAEARAHIGEQRMRLAAESTKDYLIITLDDAGLITTWNAGAERVFGYTEAEVLGKSGALIFTKDDRDCGVPEDEMRRAREHGRAEDERWHRRKDGSTLFCSGVMSRLNTDGLSGYAKIARDMTDSKRQEAAREAQLEFERARRLKAQAANELKDEFLAVMSHELKHPLNLIHINAELLMRLPETRKIPVLARSADTIRRTVLGQAKIIDDLLDLSRMRTGKLVLSTQPIVIGELVASIVDALQSDAVAKKLTLEAHGCRDGFMATCDPVRTEQIIWNLLSNALKFTPAGGNVTVDLSQETQFIRLSVTDSGRGIAAEFLPKVFGMFNQENTAAFSRAEGGMGIGLALVQELAVTQGGRVQAESEGLARGATFTVWLPRHEAAANNIPAPTAANDSLAGMQVIVVDDSPDGLDVFAMLLELEGAIVTTAANGKQALERLSVGTFDLLISDIGMPEMDGYQLVAEIRQRPELRDLPAVALTGFGRASEVERALACGFDSHLPKPSSLEQIKAVIASLRKKANK